MSTAREKVAVPEERVGPMFDAALLLALEAIVEELERQGESLAHLSRLVAGMDETA